MAEINNSLSVTNTNISQDNKEIFKIVTILGTPSTVSKSQILNALNNIPNYTVNDVQSIWFRIQYRTNQGSTYFINSTALYKVAVVGKGNYGLNGTSLQKENLELISYSQPFVEDYTSNPLVQQIEILDLNDLTISDFLNQANPPYTIQSQEIAPILFLTPEGTYLFLNVGGVYGLGQLQSSNTDFQFIPDSVNIEQNNINRYIEVTLSQLSLDNFDDEEVTRQALYDYVIENPTNIQDIEIYKWKIIENPLVVLTSFKISEDFLFDICDNRVVRVFIDAYHNGVGFYPVIGDQVFQDSEGLIPTTLDGAKRIENGTNIQLSQSFLIQGNCL